MIELESGVKGEIATVLRQEEKAVSRFATSSQPATVLVRR